MDNPNSTAIERRKQKLSTDNKTVKGVKKKKTLRSRFEKPQVLKKKIYLALGLLIAGLIIYFADVPLDGALSALSIEDATFNLNRLGLFFAFIGGLLLWGLLVPDKTK